MQVEKRGRVRKGIVKQKNESDGESQMRRTRVRNQKESVLLY